MANRMGTPSFTSKIKPKEKSRHAEISFARLRPQIMSKRTSNLSTGLNGRLAFRKLVKGRIAIKETTEKTGLIWVKLGTHTTLPCVVPMDGENPQKTANLGHSHSPRAHRKAYHAAYSAYMACLLLFYINRLYSRRQHIALVSREL